MSTSTLKLAARVALTLAIATASATAQTVEKAMTAFKAGEWPQVFTAVDAVPADSPERPRALFVAGEAHLVVGRPKEAEQCFRKVIEARPSAVPAKVGLGRALTAQGALDEAETVLADAAKSDAKDVSVTQALGELHVRAKKLDVARAELAEAWALDPKNAFVARSYCEALWAADDDANASKIVAQLAKTLPKHPMAPFLQALSLERAGKDADAIDAYEKALAIDPTFLDAHKNLAILCHTRNPTYQDAKRTDLAFEHYQRYFELGGKDDELKKDYDMLVDTFEQYFGRPRPGKDTKAKDAPTKKSK